MHTVGIVGRGLHGYKTAEEMDKFFEVYFANLPEEIPEVVESFDELESLINVVKGESLKDVLNVEVLICYATHPDVSLILAECSEAELLIITGEKGKTGSKKQMREVTNAEILMPEICCVVKEVDGFEWFFEVYGKPAFELNVEEGKISKAKVKRCAFCGATRFVKEIEGTETREAPRLAGLYTQLYPCLATRGIGGGIHLAAEMHKIAVERALSVFKSTDRNP
ncbi:MAG: hypothetical protein DSY33_05505 [Archaeoglobus sp.]|nr:MAG: hypothetical protein DSY33_05505 [Archaeoglobus sp.]